MHWNSGRRSSVPDELIELGLLLEEVAGRRLLEARLEKAG
jgi:hypothetical protein